MLQIYESPKTKKIIDKSKELKEVISDLSLLDSRNPETKTDRTVLKDYNKLFRKSEGGNGMISSVKNEIKTSTDYAANENSDKSESADKNWDPITFLPDDQEVFIEKPTIKGGEIDTWYVLEKSCVSLTVESADYAKLHRMGDVEIVNSKGNFHLNQMIGSEKSTLKWYNVVVDGKDAGNISIQHCNNGRLLFCDRMENIKVTASVVDIHPKEYIATFSTGYNSVNIREMDEDTLGIYIDRDGDGDYETPIADSNGTDYGRFDKEQENSSDASESSQEQKRPMKAPLTSIPRTLLIPPTQTIQKAPLVKRAIPPKAKAHSLTATYRNSPIRTACKPTTPVTTPFQQVLPLR